MRRRPLSLIRLRTRQFLVFVHYLPRGSRKQTMTEISVTATNILGFMLAAPRFHLFLHLLLLFFFSNVRLRKIT